VGFTSYLFGFTKKVSAGSPFGVRILKLFFGSRRQLERDYKNPFRAALQHAASANNRERKSANA
jgi:hypothetical protein